MCPQTTVDAHTRYVWSDKPFQGVELSGFSSHTVTTIPEISGVFFGE